MSNILCSGTVNSHVEQNSAILSCQISVEDVPIPCRNLDVNDDEIK